MSSGSSVSNILKGVTPIAQAIPVAGAVLGPMLQVAVQACETIDRVGANRDAYSQLRDTIGEYASAIVNAVKDIDPPFTSSSNKNVNPQHNSIIEEIKAMTDLFREVDAVVKKRQAFGEKQKQRKFSGWLRRLLYDIGRTGSDEKAVKNLRNKIETTVTSFELAIDIRQTVALQKVVHNMDMEYLKHELSPVLTARFDGNGKPPGCLENTRVKLLEKIRDWIDDKSASSTNVFFLTGLVGTGKTAIAESICKDHNSEYFKLVSFFISRNIANSRKPMRILHTIVYQMATQNPALRKAIVSALRDNQDLGTWPLDQQVEILFLSPLKALEHSNSSILLVIDALDECVRNTGRTDDKDFIPSIISGVCKLQGSVKLLMTSRDEAAIKAIIAGGIPYKSDRLQDINIVDARSDIRTYYAYHFSHIATTRAEFNIDPATWPTKENLLLLVDHTSELFVYAALVIRFVGDERMDPRTRLTSVLNLKNPYGRLGELYLEILEEATTGQDASDSKELLERVRRVIGSLIVLQSPLDVPTFATLLGMELSLIRIDIKSLSAVLLSGPQDSITIFHTSFTDFVLTRCPEERFLIDDKFYHAYLARCCLQIMESLQFNICDIPDNPPSMNSDVSDLQERIDGFLQPELRYACEYWMKHVSHASDPDGILLNELKDFCEKHLLHWVEVLSLLGKLSVGQTVLPSVIEWCKEHKTSDTLTTVTALLKDVERVMQAYDSPIRAAALQVYCSVLVFMPDCALYRCARAESVGPMRLESKRLSNWPSLYRILEGHEDDVTAVAFSPDGMHIVSGSKDKTVRVWGAFTGTESKKLEGHTEEITSVIFSPDGTRVASSSKDKTIRVWNINTDHVLLELKAHTQEVTSIASSPDGTHIVSGSGDQTAILWVAQSGKVGIWDATAASKHAELRGHTACVTSVAFSPNPNCTRIVTCSMDHSLRLWDTVTRCELLKLEGHTGHVKSVAFSSDGRSVASGSQDNTVRLWITNAENTQIIEATPFTFKGHTDHVECVAFSPSGEYIASGSRDHTIRMWNVTERDMELRPLTGHSGSITSIAFSHDGTRIASGSQDKTLRIWDASQAYRLPAPKKHKKPAETVRFSKTDCKVTIEYVQGGRRVCDVPRWATENYKLKFPISPQLELDQESGWLTAQLLQKGGYEYLYWVPPERRGRLWDFHGVVVIDSPSGSVTILCFSHD